MAEDKDSPARSFPSLGANGQNSASNGSPSPLRHRPLSRASTFAENSDSQDRRRTSHLSDSIEDARYSIHSSTHDLLLPKANKLGHEISHEASHWHSAPLAFALLPAIGGMIFKNGTAVMTDVTLLALAAVLLNWSVRLPWDWYCSAQSVQIQEPHPSDNVIEEESDEEHTNDPSSPSYDGASSQRSQKPVYSRHRSESREAASQELQTYELLALAACFLSPLLGAYLLHAIRAQLSRPSEGLVSNYNLTIFLLASELRPMSHLVKMVQSRTLYLQRVVNSNPYEDDAGKTKTQDLSKRLEELETHVADTSAQNTSNGGVSNKNVVEVTTEVRRTLQPDLDALNRAVRRYEKRATLQTMQTEARLQDLETRLSDALSLAAAAAQYGQKQKYNLATILWDWTSVVVVLPVQALWGLLSLPTKLIGSALGILEGFIGPRVKREMKTAGRIGGHGRTGGERSQVRGTKKR
ncbi:MAG: hypothetical protein M1827_000496 [Pycnora praestabilis]|nr:MAG: hypothetical protein M1827_000496 [Pycnora praestabilis]